MLSRQSDRRETAWKLCFPLFAVPSVLRQWAHVCKWIGYILIAAVSLSHISQEEGTWEKIRRDLKIKGYQEMWAETWIELSHRSVALLHALKLRKIRIKEISKQGLSSFYLLVTIRSSRAKEEGQGDRNVTILFLAATHHSVSVTCMSVRTKLFLHCDKNSFQLTPYDRSYEIY